MSFTASLSDINVLKHHGIKGQKWGVRRFQNEDGSYTSAGKKRYGKSSASEDDRSFAIKRPGKKLLGEYDGDLNADIRKARNSYAFE